MGPYLPISRSLNSLGIATALGFYSAIGVLLGQSVWRFGLGCLFPEGPRSGAVAAGFVQSSGMSVYLPFWSWSPTGVARSPGRPSARDAADRLLARRVTRPRTATYGTRARIVAA